MTEIGYYSLLIALCMSAYSALTSIFGIKSRKEEVIASSENAALTVFGFLTLASVAMIPERLSSILGLASLHICCNCDFPKQKKEPGAITLCSCRLDDDHPLFCFFADFRDQSIRDTQLRTP
jgi:hypothetical protein